jgi:hypothetical protein
LTAIQVRLTCQIVVADISLATKPFNPNEEHMGSTSFGNAIPATMIGPAMPPNIRTDRAGSCRVRVGGRA